MKKLFPFLSSIGFLVFLTILILFKIRHFDFNLSALIGIWVGFQELNPSYIPKGFVIFQEGGYDGQFFFLISRYLFESGQLEFPILDSFYFRFHRLGLSLLTGAPIQLLGIKSYPWVTLSILSFLHIFSFYMLYFFLPDNKKTYSLFYLFNPYSILGILLLVSDPLLISLGLISSLLIYSVEKNDRNGIFYLFVGMVLFSLSLLVRETSLFIIAPIIIYSLAKKQYFKITFLIPPIALYITFLVYVQNLDIRHPGTLPLRFLDMIDYPMFGFLKSWELNEGFTIKQMAREGIKILLFALYISLITNLWNIYARWKKNQRIDKEVLALTTLFIPVLATLGVITIAEQGYWRSFDNLARMFTIITPIIVIAKAKWEGYKDYGFLYLSIALTVFLLIRVAIITKPMQYVISR